jgi:putative transcriptional regulator
MRSNLPKPDLSRSIVMSDEESMRLRASDSDATPAVEDEGVPQWRRPALVRDLRRKLGLSQDAFAERYGIPIKTIREWELHTLEPEAQSMSYLLAISADAGGVAAAYAAGRASTALQAAE